MIIHIYMHYFAIRYSVMRTGLDEPQVANHTTDPDSTRIVTTWTGLNPGETYTFTVICKIQGENCPGTPPTFTAKTATCTGWCDRSITI